MGSTDVDEVAGEILVAARRAAGISQVDLAAAADVEQSMISAYERHRRQPGLPTLAKLVSAAGCRLDVAIGRGEGIAFQGDGEPAPRLRLPVPPTIAHLTADRAVDFSELTPSELRSLAIGRAVAAQVLESPERVLAKAQRTLEHLRTSHADRSADPWLDAWAEILNQRDVPLIVAYLTTVNRVGIDLRHANPFAGVLTSRQRDAALEKAKQWREEHVEL